MAAYDYQIRPALYQAGYKDSDIGYDQKRNTVTLKGQDFLGGDKLTNIAGSTFTDRGTFDNALRQFQQREQTQQPVYTTSTTQQQPYGQQQTSRSPYLSQTDQILQQLINFSQNQRPVNPYKTPQYNAYKAQSDRRAHEGIRAAQEALGSSGFGRSTLLGERAQGIQNKEAEYLETQVIPQIIASQEAQRQQEFQRLMSTLNPLMSLVSRDDNLSQLARENARADAQLTGYYEKPEVRSILDQILGLKQQAEAGGASPEQMSGFRSQADALRAQLKAMGVDPNIVGYESDYNQALQNVANFRGVPTMEARRFESDLKRDERNFNYQVEQDRLAQQNLEEEKAFRRERANVEDQRWLAEYERRGQEFAAQQGLQWAQLNQRQKEFVADEAYRQETLKLQREEKDNKNAVNMDDEKRGLLDGLRSGDLTPETALRQLEEDFEFGYYTKPQYDELRSIITRVAPNYSTPIELTEEQMESMPSDEQIAAMVPEGVPKFDWQAWYRDPRGRLAGLTFEKWQQLYGPRIGS